MPELLLHYIWHKRLFLSRPQMTTDGREVEVINVGIHNTDQGPDFTGATIRIDGIVWTGNVEIHVKTSDWFKHGHQHDPAYDNIILHVVRQADRELTDSTGRPIAQCELSYPDGSESLAQLLADKSSVCAHRLFAQPELLSAEWRDQLLSERLRNKTLAIQQLLLISHNDWEQAFYITLAHNFGFHTNGLPFELLAKQTPIEYLRKHRSSLFQLEAMIIGQSGLLSSLAPGSEYLTRLEREYSFLRKKFDLTPVEGKIWKRMRMRPQNFPEVRMAQFAALLHSRDNLFSQMLDADSLKSLRELFTVSASDEWNNAKIGRSAVDILLINTVIPYKFAWAKAHDNSQLAEQALLLLQQIPAEKNHIVSQWQALGVEVRHAADSQAFIQLYQDYCIRHKCLYCDVGYQIFTIAPATPENPERPDKPDESDKPVKHLVQTELTFDE